MKKYRVIWKYRGSQTPPRRQNVRGVYARYSAIVTRIFYFNTLDGAKKAYSVALHKQKTLQVHVFNTEKQEIVNF